MKAKFHIKLNPKDLVEQLQDTGVTAWDGGHIKQIVLPEYADDFWGEEVRIRLQDGDTDIIRRIPVHKLVEAFNEFTHKMSFTVTNGELEDLDLDAETADAICQTAMFGEVKFA